MLELISVVIAAVLFVVGIPLYILAVLLMTALAVLENLLLAVVGVTAGVVGPLLPLAPFIVAGVLLIWAIRSSTESPGGDRTPPLLRRHPSSSCRGTPVVSRGAVEPGIFLTVVEAVPADSHCLVCAEPVPRTVFTSVLCRSCGAPHHLDCWRYNGGCARYACPGHH